MKGDHREQVKKGRSHRAPHKRQVTVGRPQRVTHRRQVTAGISQRTGHRGPLTEGEGPAGGGQQGLPLSLDADLRTGPGTVRKAARAGLPSVKS